MSNRAKHLHYACLTFLSIVQFFSHYRSWSTGKTLQLGKIIYRQTCTNNPRQILILYFFLIWNLSFSAVSFSFVWLFCFLTRMFMYSISSKRHEMLNAFSHFRLDFSGSYREGWSPSTAAPARVLLSKGTTLYFPCILYKLFCSFIFTARAPIS